MSSIDLIEDNAEATLVNNSVFERDAVRSRGGQVFQEECSNLLNQSGQPATSVMQQKAIWIASYPKSGNTWVRVFIHNLMRELRGQGEESQSINALDQMTSREGLARSFAQRLKKPLQEATAVEIAAARGLVQSDMVEGKDAPIFIKTHNAVAIVEGYPTINFDVTLAAVYVVRNPLDIAVSYAHHSGRSVDTIIDYMSETATSTQGTPHRVYEFIGSWSYHTASWMSVPHRPVLTLRYEDMLTRPEHTFGRLASFLRMAPTTAQLRRAIENSSFAELVRQERAHGFIERPETANRFFRKGTSGQWKQALSHKQIKAIFQSHAPMMMRFGYLIPSSGGSVVLAPS